jgi:hypothetical protein
LSPLTHSPTFLLSVTQRKDFNIVSYLVFLLIFHLFIYKTVDPGEYQIAETMRQRFLMRSFDTSFNKWEDIRRVADFYVSLLLWRVRHSLLPRGFSLSPGLCSQEWSREVLVPGLFSNSYDANLAPATQCRHTSEVSAHPLVSPCCCFA